MSGGHEELHVVFKHFGVHFLLFHKKGHISLKGIDKTLQDHNCDIGIVSSSICMPCYSIQPMMPLEAV